MAVADVSCTTAQTGQTERVSVAGDGAQADGENDPAALSADGRFVAFSSAASNLVGDDTNGVRDVFVVGGVEVSPLSASFGAAAGTGSVDVAFGYPGTSWTATSTDPWITVTNQSGTDGNGTVSYSVAPNATGSARTGTLTVATQPVTIDQEANTAPVAQDGAIGTNEDTPVNGVLSATVSSGDPLTFSVVSRWHAGTAVITTRRPGRTVLRRGNANGATRSLQGERRARPLERRDGDRGYHAVNDAPVAMDGSLVAAQNTPAPGTLVATDVDGPALGFAVVASPAKGQRPSPAPPASSRIRRIQVRRVRIASPSRHRSAALASNVATVTVTITPVIAAATTERVERGERGSEGNGDSQGPSLSPTAASWRSASSPRTSSRATRTAT